MSIACRVRINQSDCETEVYLSVVSETPLWRKKCPGYRGAPLGVKLEVSLFQGFISMQVQDGHQQLQTEGEGEH